MKPKTLLFLLIGAISLLAKSKYFPKDKEKLLKLIQGESIKLNEIDTRQITDMSFFLSKRIDRG